MRVKNALRVLSSTMENMMQVAADPTFVDVHGRAFPARRSLLTATELCRRWNEVTDICNTRQDRGFTPIRRNDDKQLAALVDTLGFHTVWRAQKPTAPADCSTYFPIATEKTIVDMLVGLVCLACHQTDRGRAVVFRRVQQDCVEHHFAHVRQAGGSTHGVTAQQARSATAAAAAIRLLPDRLGKGNSATAALEYNSDAPVFTQRSLAKRREEMAAIAIT